MATFFKAMDRSTTSPNYLFEGFQKIDVDLQELMTCFREVLEELGQKKIAVHLPWTRPRAGGDPSHEGGDPVHLGLEQAYSVAFQLLNIVEANAATRTRRLREIGSGLTAERGLWGEQLLQLKNSGYTEQEIATFLRQVCVEPVFTAHPTEAKRGAVLEQHRMLHQLLASTDQVELTPSEKKENRRQIKLCLEKLWRSGEIFLEQPSIADERREILFYFREILPKTVLALDDRLRAAWEEVGFSPALLMEAQAMPQLHFGTWVGGDRDGHPLVTAAVTQETLLELRRRALALLHRSFDQLSNALPLSRHFQQPSEELLQFINQFSQELTTAGKEIENLYRDEPWRQFVLLIKAKLPLKFKTGERPAPEKTSFSSPLEVRSALEVLARSLDAIGAQHLVQSALTPLFRLIDVFGFHLSKLDIRQNSNFHDRALQQILQAAGVPKASSFLDWSEEQRLTFFHQELSSPKKLLITESNLSEPAFKVAAADEGQGADGAQQPSVYKILEGASTGATKPIAAAVDCEDRFSLLGEEAKSVLECYRVLQQHSEAFGWNGIGSLIVSMTRRVSDLLAVVFLAREGGIAQWNGTTVYSPIPIVPLFESREDLKNAASLMAVYLQEPSTLATLDHFTSNHSIQIMVGYSDSNKDCGIITSQWELYEAQRAMTSITEKFNVRLQFFHGRGGTISRGAGPTHLFLASLPKGSLQGTLRMTEQGETIAQKYPNTSTATYHLELLLAGVAGTSLRHHRKEDASSASLEPVFKVAEASEVPGAFGAQRLSVSLHTCGVAAAGSTAVRQPVRARLAGASELLLDDASTEATPQFAASVDCEDRFLVTAQFLAEESFNAYQQFIQTEGFMNFYEQATPLDALEASRIGSRPKRRSDQRSLTDLRAIPWVFSWNQARYFLPGWFGVGSALAALEEKEPALFQTLQKDYRQWPFLNYVLSNVETNLASAHLPLMKKYASLVTDSTIRNRIFNIIADEFQKTELQLKKVFGGSFEERRPRMAKTLALRAEALTFLHEHQIAILKEWRQAREINPAQAEKLLPQVLLSINAIASGLRTTG